MDSQLESILAQARAIRGEMARLGVRRKAALSVHASKAVIADVEARLDRLIADLDRARASE